MGEFAPRGESIPEDESDVRDEDRVAAASHRRKLPVTIPACGAHWQSNLRSISGTFQIRTPFNETSHASRFPLRC
jgi:hypothetical protein